MNTSYGPDQLPPNGRWRWVWAFGYGLAIVAMLSLLGWLALEALYWLERMAR